MRACLRTLRELTREPNYRPAVIPAAGLSGGVGQSGGLPSR
jgi:hypothetical protein